MVQTGFPGRRQEQRDAWHRTTEGGLFKPADCVVRQLRSVRPSRVAHLVERLEKTTKTAPDGSMRARAGGHITCNADLAGLSRFFGVRREDMPDTFNDE